MNEDGTVVRNKARLVCKEYMQREGIDFSDTFSPCKKIGSHKVVSNLCYIQRHQSVSDGCQVNILK